MRYVHNHTFGFATVGAEVALLVQEENKISLMTPSYSFDDTTRDDVRHDSFFARQRKNISSSFPFLFMDTKLYSIF